MRKGSCLCHGVCAEVRGQLLEASSFLLLWVQVTDLRLLGLCGKRLYLQSLLTSQPFIKSVLLISYHPLSVSLGVYNGETSVLLLDV